MDNYKALIITEDHYNALGVLRSLGECGIETVLLLTTKDKSYIEHSRYVGKTVRVSRNEEELLNAINCISKENKDNTYLLFPLSDFAALVIDKNYNFFAENVIAPHMQGKMEDYQNKEFSKMLANECGISVPKGTVLSLEAKTPDWDIFPAILKPLASVDGFKSDICIVDNETELLEKIEEFKVKKYTKLLLEEFISGEAEHMIEVMGFAAKGEVYFSGIISKVREYPIKNGSTSFAKIVSEHEDIDLENIKQYILNSNFCGLFDIEFKYANSKAYFIECNFRNGAPGYVFSCKGKNIPVGWIEAMTDIRIKRNNKATTREYFMAEQNDFINMLKGCISFKKWVNDFNNSDKLLFSSKDLKPVLVYYFRFLMQIFRRVFNRKAK